MVEIIQIFPFNILLNIKFKGKELNYFNLHDLNLNFEKLFIIILGNNRDFGIHDILDNSLNLT